MDRILSNIVFWLELPQTCDIIFRDRYCKTRDFFQLALNKFFRETKMPLLTAVAGEIGNNSFDHNLGNWKDILGVIFIYDIESGFLIIADRGQGIKKTLSNVREIETDEQAVSIAFSDIISGRYPEQRGNGLKFTANAVRANKWNLYLQSGFGCAEIINGGNISFKTKENYICGCLSIIKFNGRK
ncbi:MAG: hypothetical protein LBH29_05335 [Elusimicrobiota bacterium]|nr:hypothetical protein [Elusimicrobiota bacterium]